MNYSKIRLLKHPKSVVE